MSTAVPRLSIARVQSPPEGARRAGTLPAGSTHGGSGKGFHELLRQMRSRTAPAAGSSRTEGKSLPPELSRAGLRGKKVMPAKKIGPGGLPGVYFLNGTVAFSSVTAAGNRDVESGYDAGRGGRRDSFSREGGAKQRPSVVAATAPEASDRVAEEVTNSWKRRLLTPATVNFDVAPAPVPSSVRKSTVSSGPGRGKAADSTLALPRVGGVGQGLTLPPLAALPPAAAVGEGKNVKPGRPERAVVTVLREMERSRDPRDAAATKKTSTHRLGPVTRRKGESSQGLPTVLTQFMSALSIPKPVATGKTYGAALAGSSRFTKAIGQHLLIMVGQNQHEAILSLDPPHLGHLQVHLSTTRQNLNALFVSPYPDVRQALEAALPALRQALAQQGVALAGAFVADGGRRDASSDGNTRRFIRALPLPGVTGPGAVEFTSYPGMGNRAARGIINTYV